MPATYFLSSSYYYLWPGFLQTSSVVFLVVLTLLQSVHHEGSKKDLKMLVWSFHFHVEISFHFLVAWKLLCSSMDKLLTYHSNKSPPQCLPSLWAFLTFSLSGHRPTGFTTCHLLVCASYPSPVSIPFSRVCQHSGLGWSSSGVFPWPSLLFL